MKTSMKLVAAAAGLAMSISAVAGGFDLTPCKSCHAIDQDTVGPSFASITKAYGNAKALAKVFKSGFKPADRKIAESSARWKGQSAIMTGQYDTLIKGKDEAAAKAVFAAVNAGKK